MPSIASQYTALESLLLFQSVARHGLEPSPFSAISHSLTNNSFLKDHDNYDANRLAPAALKSLFDALIQTYTEEVPRQNGVSNEVNPRKRKISPSPEPTRSEEGASSKVPHIISQLYNRYLDQTTGEIREKEGQYQELSKEVETLQIQADAGERPAQNGHDAGIGAPLHSAETHVEKEGQTVAERARDSPDRNVTDKSLDDSTKPLEPRQSVSGQMLPPRTPGPEGQSPRPLSSDGRPLSGSRVSPAAGPILQNPQNQSPRFQGPSLAPTTGSPRQSNQLPPLSSLALQPVPKQVSGPRKPAAPAAKTSPLLPSPAAQYPPQGYGPYASPYPQQWQHAQYSGSPYYQQPYQRDQAHPQFFPHAQYPYQAQLNQYSQGSFPRPPPPSSNTPQFANYRPHPSSATATPTVSGRPVSQGRTGPTTPWTSGIKRHPSSERPQDRDVSPLSDRAVSPTPDQQSSASKATRPVRRGRSSRPGSRPGSSHSAIPSRSRSQSALSELAQRAIKPERPTTPALVTSDNEQRSTGRRRGRSNAVPFESVFAVNKRKHDAVEASQSPSLPAPPARLTQIDHDPSLVSISKYFARTANSVLGDIERHKVAGLFGKPITNREAPGYHDLVFRPQDLKSVRAAVNRGSRAANLIIEQREKELEAEAEAGGDDTIPAEKPTTLLVPKTPDLCPPLAIVNSAQMEMELTRIFANAIMYNPLPAAERALPGAYDILSPSARVAIEPTSDPDAKGYAVEDDGSIVRDTREMFGYMKEKVRDWRSVEEGNFRADDGVGSIKAGVTVGLRGGSGSVTMSDAPDGNGEGEGEDEGRGNKRRRVGE